MDQSSGAPITVIVTVAVVVVLLGLGLYVFASIALGRVFVKLGEPAWKGWVPIVNCITLLELGRYSALWAIGLFIPAANLVALVVFIMAVNNVNRRLGHGGGFTLLYLVAFPVWAGVLGFGKAVDTGWLPAPVITGYVPFAPVSLLIGPALIGQPAPPRAVEPERRHQATPTSNPAAAELPAPLPAVALLTPMPPAPLLSAPSGPTVSPTPITPPAPSTPIVRGRPTGPPPFYVSATPAPQLAAPPVPPTETDAPPRAASPVSLVAETNAWARPDPVGAQLPAPVPANVPATVPVARLPAANATAFPTESATESATETESAPAPQPAAASALADEDDLDETMIVVRRMKPWTLETEHGLRISLTKPVVLLGRHPVRGSAHPNAQLVALQDPDKTVSKTHARLDFVDGTWGIRDLQSTNGIVLIDGAGDETELDAGASASLTERFLLGELAARIYLEV